MYVDAAVDCVFDAGDYADTIVSVDVYVDGYVDITTVCYYASGVGVGDVGCVDAAVDFDVDGYTNCDDDVAGDGTTGVDIGDDVDIACNATGVGGVELYVDVDRSSYVGGDVAVDWYGDIYIDACVDVAVGG